MFIRILYHISGFNGLFATHDTRNKSNTVIQIGKMVSSLDRNMLTIVDLSELAACGRRKCIPQSRVFNPSRKSAHATTQNYPYKKNGYYPFTFRCQTFLNKRGQEGLLSRKVAIYTYILYMYIHKGSHCRPESTLRLYLLLPLELNIYYLFMLCCCTLQVQLPELAS